MRLTPKTQDFNPGRKIFIFPDGTYEISNDMELPENAILGAEIPDEAGKYLLISTYGSFVVKVDEFDGVEVIDFLFFAGEDGEFYRLEYENDVGLEYDSTTPTFLSLMAYSHDGGFVTAGFLGQSDTNLRMEKRGPNGNYMRVFDTATFAPNPFPSSGVNTRTVEGLLADENGWYIYVTYEGSSPNFFSYLCFFDFEDSQNDSYIYTGRGSTISDLDTSQFSVLGYGDFLTYDEDGNILLVWGRVYGNQRIIKFDRDLNFVSYSPRIDLLEDFDVYGDSSNVEDIYPRVMSIARVGDKYYVIGSAFKVGGDYAWESFIQEFDTDLNRIRAARIFGVLPTSNADGYHDIHRVVPSDGTLYAAGTLWNNPYEDNFDTGALLLSIDPDTLTLNWDASDFGADTGGYLDIYYLSVLLDRVYLSGYNLTSPQVQIFMYDTGDGQRLDAFFNSDWEAIMTHSGSLLP